MVEIEPGKLDGACCYLSGPMEFVADHGIEWRRRFVKLSKEAGLNIDYIDPTDKPGGIEIKIGENKEHQAELKRQGRWKELKEYVSQYRRFDLRFTDLCDFVVAVVDSRVAQWGTSNEIYVAEAQHKPMFFICEGGLKNLPNWLFDVIDLDDPLQKTRCNVFDSVEGVIQELCAYDCGMVRMNKEWVLVRKHIERMRAKSLAESS